MTSTSLAADESPVDVRELAWDIACIRGALSEIATCWRRSLPRLPGLPLRLPLQLHDTARQIEADAFCLADVNPGQAAGLATDMAARLASFQHDIAAARAMTHAPGSTGAGEQLLWDSVADARDRAGSRLPGLLVHQVTFAG